MFEFEMGFKVDATGQQGMFTPPQQLILPMHWSGFLVALHLIL
jgi:hypothetical protein